MKRALASCKPMKMWIDGKCFEIRRFQKKSKKSAQDDGQRTEDDVKYDISTTEDGKLFTSFRLPEVYYSKLSKFPDWDLKILETSTNTTISIPNRGNLVITGDSEATITEARNEIQSIVGAIRDHVSALQFVSIPTRSDEIVANFTKFKEEILSGDKIDGMEESIFQSPFKLHLTVVVFALLDDHEKSEAIKALQDYKNMILDPLIAKSGPVKIRVSGIDCMNNNYKKVDVLYANAKLVDESEDLSLQKLVNELSDHFYDRGLVRTYQDNVKLHMTLINTKYRKEVGTPRKKRWSRKQSFNATTIMEKYKDFTFGECNLDCIHLSLMGSVGDDGFYEPMSIINVN
ncbi:activating signal cointegrator 1 complex subunit 1-like [Zophobas morio]|uniref:activating signal cointegrator 1 complex subunit 1-like n=1 Tax=Zophobas morio TaxID=2755281 RepID=UPI003082E5BB